MESNLSFFSLPFVDAESSELYKNKPPECVYDDLQGPHGSLLATDDVLAQFLTADGPLEEPDLNGPTTLHCEICKKQFDNAKKYYGHLRVHSKDNLWICDKCPTQKFSTKQQLMKHSLTHKPLERVWRCPQCTMSFEALWRLQQHLFAKHLGYRPHKCDECEKSFHKPSDLKKHKDVHSDVKNHTCSICKAKYRDKSNLKRHMLRHSGETPFCCPKCGARYKQLGSMKRHAKNCTAARNQAEVSLDNTTRKNYCRVCGMSFQYKSALLEHCVRQHTNKKDNPTEPEKEDRTNPVSTDVNRTEDNIVDDILSAEDDYLTMTTQNDLLNAYNQTEGNNDNLMHIEFLKDMHHLHNLDDELFYNDIDFDTFQPSQIFNTNDDFNAAVRNEEILFDFAEGNRSMDQDLMNALYHVKAEHLPDELLNVPDNIVPEKSVQTQENVSMNECATIFESDVDLEASTNLAANLNQLIGENSVQYISTEDDDTFIISLNSEIDAEQLTDMLNIGIEVVEDSHKKTEQNAVKVNNKEPVNEIEPIVFKIVEPKPDFNKDIGDKHSEGKENKGKSKKQVLFVCRKCNKVFNKKDNYRSHIATHEPSFRRHVCSVCGMRFSYKSTLNKHKAKLHTPLVAKAFPCDRCDKTYAAAWMVKNHIERDHERLQPYACDYKGCSQKFYKKCDLEVHKRFHVGARPYRCDVCRRGFSHASHYRRHERTVDCTKRARKF